MTRKKYADELTEEELRYRLMQKKVLGREARIASYRASGRTVDEENAPINEELKWKPEGEVLEKMPLIPPIRKFDKILLFIEIAAVIGIVVMLIIGTQILTDINQEASRAMVLPTLTPTPLIQAIVLPCGHTPPDASGKTSFNQNEIPEHLRDIVDSVQPSPIPDLSGEQIVRIRIPAIEVDAPIIQGDDWESLKKGVGLNSYSAKAGKPGNIILSGHNDIFGQVFRKLDQLKTGDEIIILTEKMTYTYNVQGTQIVQPTQVEVLAQTSNATITLISCYPYLVDNQRIVVTGKLRD